LAILLGGLAAGFLDICFASVLSGATPDRVFKYIAAGWVGLPAARAGGAEMVMLGAASHFGLAWIFAAFYVLVSTRLSILRRQWLVFGLAYGASLHVFMNLVVVPLSALHRDPFATTVENFLINMVGQMLLFGLPIAYAARRYLGPN
jgi:uncharacterized membrane protein YagU involved in acid resistance